MNGVRVDLIFSGKPPTLSLPCCVQRKEPSTLILIGRDTPLLRAKIVEVLLANPETQMAVSPCYFAGSADFPSPHAMVQTAFGATAPTPLSFNVKQAAARLGISYSHIRELIHLGQIKKVHGRIPESELKRYLIVRRVF